MAKRVSGYRVKISAFIEASPTDMDQMRLAISAIDAACEALRKDGFQMVTHQSRFMLSREVPDAIAGSEPVSSNEPVARQVGPVFTPPAGVENVTVIAESGGFDGPAFLDASKRRP